MKIKYSIDNDYITFKNMLELEEQISIDEVIYIQYFKNKLKNEYRIFTRFETEIILINSNLINIELDIINTNKIIAFYDVNDIFFIILIDIEKKCLNIFDYKRISLHTKILYNWNKYYQYIASNNKKKPFNRSFKFNTKLHKITNFKSNFEKKINSIYQVLVFCEINNLSYSSDIVIEDILDEFSTYSNYNNDTCSYCNFQLKIKNDIITKYCNDCELFLHSSCLEKLTQNFNLVNKDCPLCKNNFSRFKVTNDKLKDDNYGFLNINTFEQNIDLVIKYDNETNYKKLFNFTCCVCSKNCISKDIDYLKSLDIVLNLKENLHLNNLTYENKHIFLNDFIYSGKFEILNELVLNQEGFDYDSNKVKICNECFKYLNKKKLPKLALVNNLYTGQTPDCLKMLNSIEESLICRYRLSCKIYKIYSNNHLSQNKIKGNIISFAQNVDDFLECVPNNIQLENIQILFIGPTKPSSDTLKNTFSVRKQLIIDALLWLKTYNPLYKNVKINETFLSSLPTNDIPDILKQKIHHVETANDELEKLTYDNYHDNIDNQNTNVEHNEDIDFQSTLIINAQEHTSTNVIKQINKLIDIKDDIIQIKSDCKPIREFNNENYLLGNFPVLFPYGCGSYKDYKTNKISFREYVVNLLNRSDASFRQHKSFMLACFNIIQRSQSRFNTNLFCKKKDFDLISEKLNNLKSDDLEKMKKDYNERGYIEESSEIYEILKRIHINTSNIQGSKASLKSKRQHIYSYMTKFGLPNFWLTLNPSDTNNPLMFFLGGQKITNRYFSNKNFLNRMKFVINNPFIQAKFFDKIVTNFFKHILAFNKPKGLLGKLNVYYAIIETQNRGSLHLHCLLWIEDFFNPKQYKQLLKSSLFRDKLQEYIDSIVLCDYDNLKEEEEVNENENLFDENFLMESEPMDWTSIDSDDNDINCIKLDTFVKDLSYLENSEIDIEKLKKLVNNDIYNIAKRTQTHICSEKCLDKSNVCKRGFGKKYTGKEKFPKTTIDKKTGKINIKRNNGYINEFNPFIALALKCNQDIKPIFVSQDQSLSLIYYLTNYITKNSLNSYNILEYSYMAFKSFEKYNSNFTGYEKSKLLISGIYNAMANSTEYSSAQVAAMLLNIGNDGTFYSSHKTCNLYIVNILKELETENLITNENILINLNKNDDYKDIVYDYKYRNTILENVCLYEYASRFMKIKSNSTKNNLVFLEDHFQYKSHKLKVLKEDCVPIVYGPKIPRATSNIMEDKIRYSKIMLILFKPFRKIDDILINNDAILSYKSLIEELQINKQAVILKYIENIEFLNKSKSDFEENIRNYDASEEEENIEIYDSIYNNDLIDEDYINDLDLTYNIINNNNINKYNEEFNEYFQINTNFNQTVKKIQIDNKFILDYHYINDIEKNFKIFIENIDENLFEVQDSSIAINKSHYLNKNKNISLNFREIFNNTCSKYNLNEEQIIAFSLFSENLLQCNNKQKLIYLTGAAGSGKTQVIEAIKEYFWCTNNYDKILFGAYTGVAANHIQGIRFYK